MYHRRTNTAKFNNSFEYQFQSILAIACVPTAVLYKERDNTRISSLNSMLTSRVSYVQSENLESKHRRSPPTLIYLLTRRRTFAICNCSNRRQDNNIAKASSAFTTYHNTLARKRQSLWLSFPMWRHITGSTLIQVMAVCLTTPTHHLNQCLLLIDAVNWHSSCDNFTKYTQAINH